MKISSYCIAFFALLAFPSLLQGQLIQGIIQSSSGPIPHADVFIMDVGQSTTDDQGKFSISLRNCSYCQPGKEITIFVNSDYGSTKHNYTITSQPVSRPVIIDVERNNILLLMGKVEDEVTGKLLKGIKVTPLIMEIGIEIESTITDDRGFFKFIINKSGIGNTQAIELLLQDVKNHKYKDLTKVVLITQRAPLDIEMKECGAACGERANYKISSFVQTRTPVKEGDIVTIQASGTIRVGQFVGTSGPEGIPNNKGVLGISLAAYNRFTQWNHAVLLYRFGDNDRWRYYDNRKENKFMIQEDGYIEFGINDKKLHDNSGAYDVEVIINRG